MLWGFGQTGARLGKCWPVPGHSLTLTRFTALAMPLCFSLSSTTFAGCAAGFVLGYGAINGLVTIVKATLPLALFSAESYASRTGLPRATDGSCFTLCLRMAEPPAGHYRRNVGVHRVNVDRCRTGAGDGARGG